MKQINKGYLFVVLSAVCFGINTIGIRYYYNVFENDTPENVAFWGMFASSLILLPFFIISPGSRERIKTSISRDGKIILVISIMSTVGAYLWMLGLKFMAAGPLSLITKSQVMYSAILGIYFLGEKFTILEFFGVVTALSGIIVISNLENEVTPAGIMIVLTSAFIYSVQSMLVKKFAGKLHGMEFTYLRAVLMALFFFIIFTIYGTISLIPLKQILMLGLISISGLMIGRSFYYEAHKHVPISKLSVGMLFEPVFIIIASYFILNEDLSRHKLMGAFLIVLGLWMTAKKNITLRNFADIGKYFKK